MLFSRDIPARCAWCRHGEAMDADRVICRRKGPVPADGSCRRYVYDPYKRTPPPPLKRPKLTLPPTDGEL